MANLKNTITGVGAVALNQTEAANARKKILDVIAEKTADLIDLVPVKGGRVLQLADGQFAVLTLTVKKDFDLDEAMGEYAEAERDKAEKAAKAAAKAAKKAAKAAE